MPNDTDTDVLDSTSADSVLAGGGADKSSDVLAGGGADPGADVSMQDVSGATPMASPLGGQQPGQLPPMIGQPPAGGIGPGAQQTPVGAGIHARHGGLLTGLAGVLLDGIAAGIMTPQSGQGFSQAAQRAYQMPMERQQNAALMQSFKTQAELDKAKMAIAHLNQLQAYGLVNRLTDDQRAGVTEAFMKNVDMWTDQNLVDQLATTPNRDEAAQQVHQYRSQDPDQGDQYWMYPTGHDGEGNVTQWGVYKMNPNKTVGKDTSIRIPWVDENNNPIMKDVPIRADTKMVDLAPFHNDAFLKGLMGWGAAAEKAKTAGTPNLLYDAQGNVVGAYNPKTQQITQPPAGLPGKTTQGMKIATTTAQQAGTANLAFNSFGRYQQSFRNLSPRLTETDRQALQVLTSHQAEIASNLVGYSESAIADLLTGKPLTGYSEKLMTGAMTREQYEKLSPAAQQMLADYSHAIVANFAVMKQRLGTAGARNQAMVQAEMNNIPLPYIPLSAAEKLFGDTLEDMRSYAGGGTPGAAGGTVAPSVGEVRRGYRFKGGDPSQKANWEAVQ